MNVTASPNLDPMPLEVASARPVADVASACRTDTAAGLSSPEAASRLATDGPNTLPEHRTFALSILLRQFASPLIWLLLGASLASALLGDASDAIIIAVIVALSAGLGFFNEYRAVRAAERLHDQVHHYTVVVRDALAQSIDVADLVVGDIVNVKLGDVLPADLRLITTTELECDESVLTGESLPVAKSAAPVAEGAPLAELASCAMSGTVVSSGSGSGIVVATGVHTKFGDIAAGLNTRQVETEFQKGLRKFSMFLVYVGAVLTVSIFIINVALHKPVMDALLFSLAIAVGITPQLLPAVVSTSLAAGSSRLAKVKILIKRLVCIEDLGDVSLLFTDKTGTLTQGTLTFDSAIPAPGHTASETMGMGLLATETLSAGEHAVGGNPLDQALWDAAQPGTVPSWTKTGTLPFDHDRRMVSVAVTRPDGSHVLITKGAPETMLERCVGVPQEMTAAIAEQFAAGSRLVAVATKELSAATTSPTAGDETGLTLVGLLAFLDPPKSDAKASLDRLARLGVSIKVVTGDNPEVARKVCHDLGLPDGEPLTGPQVAKLTDEELAATVASTTVFARVSPQDKARIVAAGRANVGGVAFLGDGVNDALALHTADIGISVDTATDVAKDAADVIMLEKDLNVLADGVCEGRRIFANTIKYVMMGTSSNFGNMFSAAGASIFLPFLPMLPSQILLNNLLYDAGQLTIPTDHVDEEQLAKPSHWDISFIRRFMIIFGPLSSAFDFATFAILLWVFKASETVFQTGWFIESLATQALVIFAIRTRRIPFFKSRPSWQITAASFAVIVAGWLLPLSPLARMLKFTPPPISFYAAVAGLVIGYLLLVEFGKYYFYRSLPTGLSRAKRPAARRTSHQRMARTRARFRRITPRD